jgi:hypothetical protein
MPFDPSKSFEVEDATTPPVTSAPPKPPSSSFDPSKPFTVEDKPSAPTEEPTTFGGTAGRFAAGVNTNLIAGTLSAITGMPTDVANAITRNPLNPQWKAFHNPLPAEWWNHKLAQIGIGTEAAPPRNTAERIAQGAGLATGSALWWTMT